MRELGIPNKFKLFGYTITVKEIPVNLEVYGDFNFDSLTITLYTGEVNDELILHTFYHECCHAMTFLAGFEDLVENETFCDTMGALIYQVVHGERTSF